MDISMCNASTQDGTKKCLNGGRCVDGLGATFSCQCSDGWTGEKCEDNVDECIDSPCTNGGMCMDMPGKFFCSCPFGILN
jgi:hypothetical protein